MRLLSTPYDRTVLLGADPSGAKYHDFDASSEPH